VSSCSLQLCVMLCFLNKRFRLAMMLNFDMMGSPNYFVGVYNGTSASKGSGVIQQVFQNFAAARKYPTQPTPFTGRSDYGPFLDLKPGFPAGGLFTGAEEIKGSSERTAYGGMERVAYDPCYHQDCDTIDNINWNAIDITSQMAAQCVSYFGFISNLRAVLGSVV
jgi:Zn-dependent M28 family amino/carboxypeptidase